LRVRCDNCGKHFDKKPSEVERHEHNFCSRECYWEFLSSRIEVECANCGKKVAKKASYVRESELSFCSTECYDDYRDTYTEEEDRIIRENIHLSDREIAEKLGDRSKESVRVRRHKLGLMKGQRRWPEGDSSVRLSRSHLGRKAPSEVRSKKSDALRKLGADDLLSIVSLRESGMTYGEIREALGLDVSPKTIGRYHRLHRSGRYVVKNGRIELSGSV